VHVAGVVVGEEAFAALAHPQHGSADATRRDEGEAVLREGRFFQPEGAADIG
jgi:hypothetical protein